MPRRADLRSVLIIGSGPIRIGQGCEFDYSASQACRVLRREGLRVVLVNSNPATIMTDPEWADATYIEPLDLETVTEVIAAERPGRAAPHARRPDRAQPRRRAARGRRARASTASSCSARASTRSAAPRTGSPSARRWSRPGCRCPCPRSSRPGARHPGHVRCRRSSAPRSRSAAAAAASRGRAEELEARIAARPRGEPGRAGARRGVARGLAGVRARGDVRSRGQLRRRLLDREPRPDGRAHRRLVDGRAAADAARRRVPAAARGGVRVRARRRRRDRRRERAVRLRAGDARAARDRDEPARVALVGARVEGDRLPDREDRRAARDRLHARRAAERHHAADDGGVRAGARLRRREGAALRLREVPGRRRPARQRDARRRRVARARAHVPRGVPEGARRTRMRTAARSTSTRRGEPVPERWDLLLEAARQGLDLPGIHPYFARAAARRSRAAEQLPLVEAKRFGIRRSRASAPRSRCASSGPLPGRLAVDSCAAEFEARTPYFYLSYEPSDDAAGADRPRDRRARLRARTGSARGSSSTTAACTRRSTFRALGYEAVLVNPNPETVSTDYDTSDRLYLEPLTLERALDVCALEQPLGVVVSFGGQTPLRLAPGLVERGRAAARRSARRDRRGRGPRPLRAAARRARPERAAVARGRRRGRGARGRRRARLSRCSCGRTT